MLHRYSATVVTLAILLLSGCAPPGTEGKGSKPTDSAPASEPTHLPTAPPAASPNTAAGGAVNAADVAKLLGAVSDRPFALSWRMKTAEGTDRTGNAGYRRNGDRFYLTSDHAGFLQLRLQTWQADSQGTGWQGPFPGGLPQVPGLSYLCTHPEVWGAVGAMREVHRYHRRPTGAGSEMWTADLDLAGEMLPWLESTENTTALTVAIQNVDGVYLPVSFHAEWVTPQGNVTFDGQYQWTEPSFPQAPSDAGVDLGLFGINLGYTRDNLEPINFMPTERKPGPNGSEWALEEGIAVQYDASGRVITLVQTGGGLINGLRVGDDRDAVVRYLGEPARVNDQVLEYDYPGGNKLLVRLDQGKVVEFRAEAPASP